MAFESKVSFEMVFLLHLYFRRLRAYLQIVWGGGTKRIAKATGIESCKILQWKIVADFIDLKILSIKLFILLHLACNRYI